MRVVRSKRAAVCWIGLAAWTALSLGQEAAPEAASDERLELSQWTLPAIPGGRASLAELAGEQATLLVFLSTECPISNGYLATLARLRDRFREQGVAVIGVNSNRGQGLRQMDAHRLKFEIKFPLLKDAGAQLAHGVGATTCPEAVLLDRQSHVRYRGRIDDRYSRRGAGADAVRTADLERAIEQVLAGEPVATPRTKTVGCPIQTGERPIARADAEVDYCRHVAPLLAKHCQQCHRDQGSGPFALETYEQALVWCDDIREFTQNGQMPPWKPMEGHGDFKGSRAMSPDDIETIARWVDSGCAEGDRRHLPPAPDFVDGWTLGEPDLILSPEEDFELAADGEDVYRCFVIPTDFDTDRYVVALEVAPGNPRIVHHVIAFLDTSDRSTALDDQAAGPGYPTSQGYPGFLPAGGLGGWAPGNRPTPLPDGMAKVLPAGAKVVMQVHYHKTGRVETDRTRLGLRFSRTTVKRAVRALPVMPPGARWNMRIPAGDDNFEVRASLNLPDDVLGVAVTPHMHLLGKDMRLDATLPDGDVLPLLYVNRWDFNWQETYHYRDLVNLPRGTRLDLVAHYDNSADNPRNPNRPPRLVRWGEQTSEEMCIAFLEVAPRAEARSPEDLKLPSASQQLYFVLRSRLPISAPSNSPDSKDAGVVKGLLKLLRGPP